MAPAEIVAFRERHGLTQARLAALLGLPSPEKGGQVTVARWERGDRHPAPYLRLALRQLAATELATATG